MQVDTYPYAYATGGATIVLVAHRLSTVIGADKIAVMHEGVLVEQGNHRYA